MEQGIEKDNLKIDINKLEYQNNEINKDLKEIFSIKQQLDSNYTNPINQDEINNSLQSKIDLLRENRNREIELFKDKIIQYKELTAETEVTFNSVKTDIKVE